MFGTILLVSIVLMTISFIGLGLNIFFRKDGKFPETEIGQNKAMRKLGITCVKCDEARCQNHNNGQKVVNVPIKIHPERLKIIPQ
jgi:hypothetical protein